MWPEAPGAPGAGGLTVRPTLYVAVAAGSATRRWIGSSLSPHAGPSSVCAQTSARGATANEISQSRASWRAGAAVEFVARRFQPAECASPQRFVVAAGSGSSSPVFPAPRAESPGGTAESSTSSADTASVDGASSNGAEAEKKLRVALFDLDRTLIDCNSANLWLMHEIKEGNVKVRDAVRGAYWLIKYRLGHGGAEKPYAEAVAKIAGQKEADLSLRAKVWFDHRVRPRLRPGAVEAIRQHRANGDRLVLATSSTLYAAEAALEHFGLDEAICTTFELDEERRFTGRIASFAYGDAKAERVREWAAREAVDLADCVFYTDSVTDLDLLEIVGSPVVVNPDHRLRKIARERAWPIVDWGLSSVRKETQRRAKQARSARRP
eukprot:tig00020537_g10268.t1